ncbi:nicotinate phosphoribosyltransferase [Rothia dentocariosa]|uniref:nicotinate phosphoribosyltransferase n=1 Tax=Rothia dentocariosa TaxID=2047 RepID=UPI0028E4120B|nr:nicotinate phosphoribosyltransferase [Rothia dentocariosa]
MRHMATTSLLTDHYELTMLQAALASGTAHRRCTFEVFTRRLPAGRRYGVLAGTGRFLEGLQSFRFDDEDLSFLASRNVVNAQTLKYLENFRFTGNIRGYVEGEIFFPHSPVVQVEATFAEACVLETYLLSILNYDSAVASAASRMTAAAGHRPCIEMGSRRAHERAAVSAARAAAIAGFTATSNLEAGRRYGLHTLGTSAHAFTLLYDSEREAFEAQLQSLGARTTLLADTYDVENAVRLGVELAGEELGGVRLDSGDLVASAQRVRELLDSLGNHNTKITVTSDLDEYAIASLAAAPVDSYGVGTRLVTGSGAPTSAMVYKLVERENTAGELEPVAKTSAGKRSLGGAKQAARRHNSLGIATAELIGTGNNPAALENTRDLIRDFVVSGELLSGFTGEEAVRTATKRHSASLAELPESARRLSEGEPVIPTEFI